MPSTIIVKILFITAIAIISTILWAGTLPPPDGTPQWKEFSDDETLSASELNNHFDAIAEAVNDNAQRLANLPFGFGYLNSSFSRVTFTKVLLGPSEMIGPVSPGTIISVSMNYTIYQEPECPLCIDQILVGFSHENPVACVYNGIPELTGTAGSGSFDIVAPSTPGRYYLAFDKSLRTSCELTWWLPEPGIFGEIVVVE